MVQYLDCNRIIDIKTELDKAGVPSEGRLLFLNPKNIKKTLRKTHKLAPLYPILKDIYKNGRGMLLGFELFLDNSVPMNETRSIR